MFNLRKQTETKRGISLHLGATRPSTAISLGQKFNSSGTRPGTQGAGGSATKRAGPGAPAGSGLSAGAQRHPPPAALPHGQGPAPPSPHRSRGPAVAPFQAPGAPLPVGRAPFAASIAQPAARPFPLAGAALTPSGPSSAPLLRPAPLSSCIRFLTV